VVLSRGVAVRSPSGCAPGRRLEVAVDPPFVPENDEGRVPSPGGSAAPGPCPRRDRRVPRRL